MNQPASDPAGEPDTVPPVPARRYSPPPPLRRYLRRLPTVPGSDASREPR